MVVLIIDCYIGLFGTDFMQVCTLGRAPRRKETLPDFREKCRVTRHSRVFRELTGSYPSQELQQEPPSQAHSSLHQNGHQWTQLRQG